VAESVDTIDTTAVSTEVFALNHSTYSEKIALLSDIQLLSQTGERPPDKRVPILERVKTGKGDYWRYPKLGRQCFACHSQQPEPWNAHSGLGSSASGRSHRSGAHEPVSAGPQLADKLVRRSKVTLSADWRHSPHVRNE
jgi:hypothetical protein